MARTKKVDTETGRNLGITGGRFPSFHKSGSIIGMKKLYYGKDALLVRCGDYIYKVTQEIYDRIN